MISPQVYQTSLGIPVNSTIAQVWPNLSFHDKIGHRIPLLQKQKGESMSEKPDEILTIDEVAAYLKAGKRTVYRLAASGKIPAFKLGGSWRFRRGELDQWIASRIGKAALDDDEGAE
ncbi:Prophage DNA-binding transcriptional regulator AlpA [Chromobacterium vaccinii]|nr:Prophage DNA-binding transcriptional regulator AlpA [Chromobacterium vaccinii]QND88519.1 Prophage DNA-binding transcriptional regulator AlpA [Chromobacterium vaccinii]